jgi:ABC-type multidrug transport system fused ATPase/permease subunit
VGIIGRTGAGKSSLVATLFRIINLKSGHIHIDGLDIQKLSLRKLRRSISIIPQNPILMAGTIRHNLDPFLEFADTEIWSSLKYVQLEKKIG